MVKAGDGRSPTVVGIVESKIPRQHNLAAMTGDVNPVISKSDGKKRNSSGYTHCFNFKSASD